MSIRAIWKVPLILIVITILFAENIVLHATNIPTFLTEPADTNVVRSLNAELNCMATGNPVPKVVSWMKDGTHVVFDGTKSILPSGSLRISNALASDDGYYQCVAQNSVGSVISKRAKLTVAYFDMLYTTAEDKTQAAGSSLVLIVPTVTCNPKPKYTWKKNGVKLVEDARISVSRENTLYIADLKGSDLGTYTCEAENTVMLQAGKPNAMQVVKNVRLSIGAMLPRYQAPSLIRSPKDTTARQGVDVVISLECFPNRSDTSITWKKNGAVLYANQKYRIDSTRKRLTLNGPIKNDEGQYSCEASYLTQRATGSGNLRVIVPPTYTNQKTVVNAQSDNNTILWCNATAYPSFSSNWYHNSKRIFSSGPKYQLKPDRSLHISQLKWADAGVYQCLSQNSAGQLIGTIRLNVLNKTAVILQGPTTQYFHVGVTAVIPCTASGAPKPTIQWLRNNQAIHAALTRISVTSKGSLQITNSQKSDSATYTCVASNGAGDSRKSGYIGIVDPTRITKGPNKTTVAARAVTVILPCEVSHDPTVNVTRDWRKNTVKLNDPRYSMLRDGSLQILSTQQVDAATFSCNVYSNGGNASVSTVLQIVSLPLSPSTPVASEIATYSLRLTWFAPEYDGGTPLTNYELHMKNQTGNSFRFLMFTKLTSVVISSLQAGKKYSFRVAARNVMGRGWWSGATAWIPMKILAPSQRPTNLHTVSSEQTKITLRWTPPPLASHNGELRGYNVYYRGRGYINSAFNKKVAPAGVIGASTVTYVLDNLLYFTQYEIKVAAFNDAGVGLESSIIFTETKPGIPTKGPTDVKINVINSTAVKVSYKSPAQIYWNGELISSRGYTYEPGKPLDAKTFDAPYNRATRYNQTFILLGLKASLQYALRVAVVTASGSSPKSDPVFFRMHEGSPGSPRNLMVTGTFAHAITLRWDRPYATNGVLLGYRVGHRRSGTSDPWTDRPEPEPAYANGAIYRGLQLNTRYEFYALAFTRAGNGNKVFVDAQTMKTAPTLPGKPTKPMLVDNNGTFITLNWLMGSTGGTLITYYLIESNNQSNYHQLTEPQREWTIIVNLTRTQDIPARIHNLTTNRVYRFRVTPFNSVGRGPTSNVSEDITTAESAPHAAPTRLRASAKARQELSIDWLPPPKHTWGSAAISYRIVLVSVGRKNKDSIIRNHPDSQLKSYIARGLAKWTYYNVTVTVYNNVGAGPPGMWVLARTSEDVPDNGPATITAVAISSSVVNVTWTPVPVNLRNGRILGYKVFYNIKPIAPLPAIVFTKHISDERTRTTLLTGLAGYATYQIRMLAFTKSGDGHKTDFIQVVTPDGIAGKPYNVTFPVVRLDFVRVQWYPPLHPNGIIASYEVAYKLKGTADNWVDVKPPRGGFNELAANVQGLSGNRYYLFRVYARTTRLGRGNPAEETVKTTPNRQVPERPVMLPIPMSDIETTAVLVKWVPAYDGESPIRSYSLQFKRKLGGWLDYRSNLTNRIDIDASLRQLRVVKLLPARSYSFRIKATNDIGDSAWSQASEMITTHSSAPSGAPTNIRITPVSATSLRIEWKAPSYEALNGLPVEFLMRYKRQGLTNWERSMTLPKTPLYKQIDNLEVFTVYVISMAAKNINGSGPWIERTGTTGESRPTGAPSNIRVSAQDATTIKVRWTKPPSNTIGGNLLGYKIEYQRLGNSRRRKRRAVSLCPLPDYSVKTVTVGPYTEEATIRNIAQFSKYRVTIRAYNGAGDGPKSNWVEASTPEGKPSAPIMKWSKGYKNAIDIQWSPPCFSNGHLTGYEVQYSLVGSATIETIRLPGHARTARIRNLASPRNYKIQVKAKTRNGYGEFATTYISTNSDLEGLPGKPGKPVILKIESTAMLLKWKEGTSGNLPITKYNIQYLKADETRWKTGWVVTHDKWTRNDTNIQYKVTNLTPETRYSFRVVAENALGASEASETTSSVITGGRVAEKPFHAELWFIILLVVVAILIIALLVLFICLKRRSKKPDYNPAGPTRSQQLQQQSRDLKQHLSTDVKETFLTAYGEDNGFIKSKSNLNTESRHEPRHKLEKLDLKPLAFAVPMVPDEREIVKRRAPEGEDSSPVLRKRSPRERPEEESRFSYGEKKRFASDDNSISSDDNEKKHSFYSREKRESRSPKQIVSNDDSRYEYRPKYSPPTARERLEYAEPRQSKERSKSYHEEHRVFQGSRESLHSKAISKPRYQEDYDASYAERFNRSYEKPDSPRSYTERRKARGDSNREHYDDDVFVSDSNSNAHRVSRRSAEKAPRYQDNRHGSPMRGSERHERNHHNSNRTSNQKPAEQWELSFDDDGADISENDSHQEYHENRERDNRESNRKDHRYDADMDYDKDWDYRHLVKDLTRDRVNDSHFQDKRSPDKRHPIRREEMTRERDAVKTNEVATNNKPGLSNFELAMVRNRGGSAQRLINTDSEVDSRSVASKTSKKSRASQDKRATKEAIDEASESSVSKHSDVSDNDADKSGNETEEDGKFVRGKAAEASIASHYANDPFYRNWRSSLDKKTRKAILAEYHDKNKKNAAVGDSVDSVGSRPYRSASEEGLDRIERRPRVRPGRYDLSEKRKLTQSDPYLNQEPAPSVSSFSPSAQCSDPPRSRRPGKRGIDRAAANSEPSLNVRDSESDSDNRFPPPYDGDKDEGGRVRRKNSFLRATEGEEQSRRRSSREELQDTPVKAKKKMAAELDKAVGYYTRAPPPYEDNAEYDSEGKSPPAYTPVQDSSDDSRAYVGYNRGPRNWRPQRQQERRDVSSPQEMEQRRVPNRRSDEFDGPSKSSMTLV